MFQISGTATVKNRKSAHNLFCVIGKSSRLSSEWQNQQLPNKIRDWCMKCIAALLFLTGFLVLEMLWRKLAWDKLNKAFQFIS